MTDLQIAEITHSAISFYRFANGRPHYPPFKDISESNKSLYSGVIEGIRVGEIKTKEDVHKYWREYAEKHLPNHDCLRFNYLDLSFYEQNKDEIGLEVIKLFLRLK
jgi:hypothetical protein